MKRMANDFKNIIKFAGMTSSSSFVLKHTLLQVIGIAISTFKNIIALLVSCSCIKCVFKNPLTMNECTNSLHTFTGFTHLNLVEVRLALSEQHLHM